MNGLSCSLYRLDQSFLCLCIGSYLAIKTRPELFRAFSAPWQMPWKSLYLTIWDIFTVYAISLCFYKKCSMRSKYERVQLCCALSVRQITRRNALKVRVFFGSSALLPALKSVQNRCEIFNGFYLKFRPIKVYRGGIWIFCNWIFDVF